MKDPLNGICLLVLPVICKQVNQLVNFRVPDPRENGNKQAQELHHLPTYYLDQTKSKSLREEDQMLFKDSFMTITTQNPSNAS